MPPESCNHRGCMESLNHVLLVGALILLVALLLGAASSRVGSALPARVPRRRDDRRRGRAGRDRVQRLSPELPRRQPRAGGDPPRRRSAHALRDLPGGTAPRPRPGDAGRRADRGARRRVRGVAVRSRLAARGAARRDRRLDRRRGGVRPAEVRGRAPQRPHRRDARDRVGRQRPDGGVPHGRADRHRASPRPTSRVAQLAVELAKQFGIGAGAGIAFGYAAGRFLPRTPPRPRPRRAARLRGRRLGVRAHERRRRKRLPRRLSRRA